MRAKSAIVYGLPVALGLALLTAAGLADEPRPLSMASPSGLASSLGKGGWLKLGDAHLRGRLALSRRTEKDGHYEVPLSERETAVLTLDPRLQARAERLLSEASAPYGAAVVMSLDGRLLALAGASRAEPSRGGPPLALEAWAPAASVFKVVTGAALVDRGVAPGTSVCYHGGLRSLDPSNLKDDPRRDTACETLSYGLARSQNAIIAKLASRYLDPPTLRRYAEVFGFGVAPDFALQAGPTRATIPETPLEFARVAAGFWNTELSPLAGALLIGIVASDGLAVTPRVVSTVRDSSGSETPIIPRAPKRVLPAKVARALTGMLIETTRTGTAKSAFYDRHGRPYLGKVAVAGKTGSLSQGELTYSWFVAFAPADHPRYVISVLLANSPTWRMKAHTLARLLLETALTS